MQCLSTGSLLCTPHFPAMHTGTLHLFSKVCTNRNIFSPLTEPWHPFPISSLVLLSVPSPDALSTSKTQAQPSHGMYTVGRDPHGQVHSILQGCIPVRTLCWDFSVTGNLSSSGFVATHRHYSNPRLNQPHTKNRSPRP